MTDQLEGRDKRTTSGDVIVVIGASITRAEVARTDMYSRQQGRRALLPVLVALLGVSMNADPISANQADTGAPAIVSFTATPAEVEASGTVTVKWSVRNSSSIEILWNDFPLWEGSDRQGQLSSLPSAGTVRYTLRAERKGYKTATAQVTVEVADAPRTFFPATEDGVVEIMSPDGGRAAGAVIEIRNGDAWIVTADHVVQTALLAGRKTMPVRFRGADTPVDGEILEPLADNAHDLAIVAVDGAKVPRNVYPVELSAVTVFTAGINVSAIGHPVTSGPGWILDRGSVTGSVALQIFFSCDTSAPGSSGGPLMAGRARDGFPQLIGIVTDIDRRKTDDGKERCAGTATSVAALHALLQSSDPFGMTLRSWIKASATSFDSYRRGTDDPWLPPDAIPDADWCTGSGRKSVGCVYRPVRLETPPEDDFNDAIAKVTAALGAQFAGSEWKQDDSRRDTFDADGVRTVDFKKRDGTIVAVDLTKRGGAVYQIGIMVVAPAR